MFFLCKEMHNSSDLKFPSLNCLFILDALFITNPFLGEKLYDILVAILVMV